MCFLPLERHSSELTLLGSHRACFPSPTACLPPPHLRSTLWGSWFSSLPPHLRIRYPFTPSICFSKLQSPLAVIKIYNTFILISLCLFIHVLVRLGCQHRAQLFVNTQSCQLPFRAFVFLPINVLGVSASLPVSLCCMCVSVSLAFSLTQITQID